MTFVEQGATTNEGHDEEVKSGSETKHQSPENKKKSWMALATYVDELTLGGRRDSKGRFVDTVGNFPGFGYAKKVKIPQDCFPATFYDRYAL